MRLTTLLIIFSVVGCANIPRPNTDLCVVNAPGHHEKCYNLNRDYDDNGVIKKDAKPTFKPANTVDELNKNICTDPDGWANLKAYLKELKDALNK